MAIKIMLDAGHWDCIVATNYKEILRCLASLFGYLLIEVSQYIHIVPDVIVRAKRYVLATAPESFFLIGVVACIKKVILQSDTAFLFNESLQKALQILLVNIH